MGREERGGEGNGGKGAIERKVGCKGKAGVLGSGDYPREKLPRVFDRRSLHRGSIPGIPFTKYHLYLSIQWFTLVYCRNLDKLWYTLAKCGKYTV